MGKKAWSKEDIQKSAMLYVADNTHLDEASARGKINDIVEYVINHENDLGGELSDCEGIDNAVSLAALEMGL
jgi:hypothetical protein